MATLALCSILAPLLSTHSADTIDFSMRLQAPSPSHPFGTDDLGRDMFVRVMRGGRISLAVGASAMLMALVIGLAAGGLAGYRAGFVDSFIMRTVDVFLSVPLFLVVLLMSSLLTPGLLAMCVLIGLSQWMEVARVVRAVVISAKEEQFVEAARALGVSDHRILVRHVLLHTSGPVAVTATIVLAQAIMMESAISFLGFGVQPPHASWGGLLHSAQSYLGTAPWIAVFPGLMIFVTVLCCYVVGDFLRASLRD